MSTRVTKLTIEGDASGALGAIAEVEGAIQAVHGKEVEVRVRYVTDGGGGGAREMGDFDRAARGAGDSARRFGEDADRAGDGARHHAEESERAADAARDHGEASRGAGDAVRSLGEDSDRTSRSLGELGGGSAGLGELEGRAGRASGAMGSLGESSSSARRFMVDAGGSAGELASGMEPVASRASSAGRQLESMASSSRGAAIEMHQMADGSYAVAGAADEAGSAGRKTYSIFGTVAGEAGRAASETDGFAGALGGAGRAMLQLGSGTASGDLGLPTASLSDMKDAMGPAMGAAGTLAGGLKTVGIAAAYSAVGMGALSAVTGAVGLGAVALEAMRTPALMNDARKATQSFTQGLDGMRSATAAAASAGMSPLKSSVNGLGKEIGAIAAGNVGTAMTDMTALSNSATGALKQLAPAIAPAERGMTALGQAALGALGNSGGQIAQFSNVLAASAPGLQSDAESVVRGATALGGAAVQIASLVAPEFQVGANILAGMSDFAVGAFGGSANYSATPGPDGSVPAGPTFSSRAGSLIGGAALSATGAALTMVGGGGIGVPMQMQGNQTMSNAWTGAGAPSGAAPPPAPGQLGSLGHPYSNMVGYGQGNQSFPSPYAGNVIARDPTQPGGTITSGANAKALQSAQGGQGAQWPGPGGGITPTGQKIDSGISRQSGSGAPLPGGSVGAQIAATMGQVNQGAAAMRNYGAAAQSSLTQAGSAASTSSAGVQRGMQGVTQSVSGAHAAVQPAAQQLGASIAPAVQRGVQSAPPPAAPMRQMVAQATSSAMPAADAGGQDVGGAVTGGMGKGVTKTETSTLTIVKNWVTNVIDAAAGALDAHSPSRKFVALGQSIPDGLGVGVQARAGAAINSTQNMIGQVVAGAQGALGDASGRLGTAGRGLSGQLGQGLNSQPGSGQLGQGMTQRPPGAQQTQQQRDLADRIRASQQFDAGVGGVDRGGQSPQAQQDAVAQQRAKLDASGRRAQLDKLGYSDATKDRVMDREAGHNARAQEKRNAYFDRREDMLKALGHNPAIERQDALRAQQQQAAQQVAQQPAQDKLAAQAANPFQQFIGMAQQAGQSLTQGAAQGIQAGTPAVQQAGTNMAGQTTDAVKKKWGVHSPSTVMAEVGADVTAGVAGGAANGMAAGSALINSVASDSGLQVGYSYARSVETGIQSVLQKSDYEAAGFPQLTSALAKTELGALNLMGPAGAGAMINKILSQSFPSGGGTPAVQQPIQVTAHLYVDGSLVDSKITNAQNALLDAVAVSIGQQRDA